MKTTRILAILVLALGLTMCWAGVSEAVPMGMAFTYQGRLIDANSPADGLYDLQFKLFDDPGTGTQVGSDVNKPDIDVIDGYFTVELDFNDVNSFNGEARWLEIGVRPGELNDPNVYTTLNPRQEITPTPYALYAASGPGVPVPLELSGSVASPGAVISGTNTGSGIGVFGSKTGSNASYGYLGSGGIGVGGVSTGTGDAVVGYNLDTGTSGYLGRELYGVYGIHSTSGNYGYLGDPNYGVYGESISGYGVSGRSTNGVAVRGRSDNGDGVVGWTGASDKSGVFGNSTAGIGVKGRSENNYGVYGKNVASGNYGVLGNPNYGVYGVSTSSYGVYGYSSNGTGVGGTGSSAGVEGYSSSGTGVYGTSTSGDGVYGTSSSGYGVGGYSSSGYGVYGSSSSGYAGYFNGNLHVDGNITYTGSISDVSDIRLKENITLLKNGIEKISCLQGIYFNNKGESLDNREVGVIAQDVEKVLPELVSTDKQGYKSVDYTKLTPVLIEAVKELKAENELLKQRLDALERTMQQPQTVTMKGAVQ